MCLTLKSLILTAHSTVLIFMEILSHLSIWTTTTTNKQASVEGQGDPASWCKVKMLIALFCLTLSCVQLFVTPWTVWNFPGQNTGVGSLSLLQGIFPTKGSNPGLPHHGQILYQLSHKGSPRWILYQLSHKGSRKGPEGALNSVQTATAAPSLPCIIGTEDQGSNDRCKSWYVPYMTLGDS